MASRKATCPCGHVLKVPEADSPAPSQMPMDLIVGAAESERQAEEQRRAEPPPEETSEPENRPDRLREIEREQIVRRAEGRMSTGRAAAYGGGTLFTIYLILRFIKRFFIDG